ncbi:MAG: TMEM175 family protein [Allosphingosinicella sp.]
MAGGTTEHALERMVFFSDAVFAIAITLLVIEIHVPHLEHGASDLAFWAALAGLIPNFVGYLVSFAVIGAFWIGHHRAFCLAGRHSNRVTLWNLMLLGTIAFMPFVTAFMSAHPGARVPALFYWGWLLLTALINLKVNRIATGPEMLAENVDPVEAAAVPRRSLSVLLGAATSFALAFFLPVAAPAGMATIPLWRGLMERGAKRKAVAPGHAAPAAQPHRL